MATVVHLLVSPYIWGVRQPYAFEDGRFEGTTIEGFAFDTVYIAGTQSTEEDLKWMSPW
jgi:hypothetical protein